MSDLSIDELLAKAEGKKRLRCENDSRVLTYLERTKLEPGLMPVPTYVIFWHYRQIYTYSGLFNQNKARKVGFFRTFSKRFPQMRKKLQRFYLLNPEQLKEFTEEVNGIPQIRKDILQTAKQYNEKYGNQKHPKKKALQLSGQEGNSSDET